MAREREALNVLTFNAGSSSLKVGIYAVEDERTRKLQSLSVNVEPTAKAFSEAAHAATTQVLVTGIDVSVVGHRVVFGGPEDLPTLATPQLLDRLEGFVRFDPLHAPGALACLREALRQLPDRPQVVCFDTAFFREMPDAARRLPIPVGDDKFLRRYGFHGLSYDYVRRVLGDRLNGRAIVAHLGSGASLAALQDGRPIETTMGFSSLGGVLMASRPGDLDPGVLLYLLEERGVSAIDLRTMLETASGLRALADGEGDLRRLLERTNEPRAQAAVAAFVMSVIKAVGALSAMLCGLDTLVFTGGVGQHIPEVRAQIMRAFQHLGLSVDKPANAASAEVISKPSSRVLVRVIETDENATIAQHAFQIAQEHR